MEDTFFVVGIPSYSLKERPLYDSRASGNEVVEGPAFPMYWECATSRQALEGVRRYTEAASGIRAWAGEIGASMNMEQMAVLYAERAIALRDLEAKRKKTAEILSLFFPSIYRVHGYSARMSRAVDLTNTVNECPWLKLAPLPGRSDTALLTWAWTAEKVLQSFIEEAV